MTNYWLQKRRIMKAKELTLKVAREAITRLIGYPKNRGIDNSRVQYFDDDANKYIYQQIANALSNGKGYALGKLGTVELGCIVSYLKRDKWTFDDYAKFLRGYPVPLFYEKEILRLNNNAGVFPAKESIGDKFCELMLKDIDVIDTLASYAWCERYILKRISHCSTVNLDGYYAPFMFKQPWTRILENKRVLVIHPFAKSIESQYAKREALFSNPLVLPRFKSLRVIQAVQSIAGNSCGFTDWFSALNYMKDEMEKEDFDIALIGCGAYGFPLTAHAKRLNKVGIHLAGWTQMLFGIYGKRWLTDQPQYAKFINDDWIRPNEREIPSGAKLVEGGCYW